MTDGVVRLVEPCVVVLVGAAGSGKTTWADRQFGSDRVVSSDRIRALVGMSEDDQTASKDAFAVLDDVIERRISRRLTTVVDTTGLDPDLRSRWLELAQTYSMRTYAVPFEVDRATLVERNKARTRPLPQRVLSSQAKRFHEQEQLLTTEGFEVVLPAAVRLVAEPFAAADRAAEQQRDDPKPLAFGLQVAAFDWGGGPEEMGRRLSEIAVAAEVFGFESIWVMDHFIQIPQVGRTWDPMLESYTALAYMAAQTRKLRLGALVTAVGYRNIAHLAKVIATLDVLSGGRAECGLGAGWYKKEAEAYGYEFQDPSARLDRVEDAAELLPLMWGPGSPPFEGRTISVKEALCYPRPIQENIPVLIGGGGEQRTLRLVAKYADACNLFGTPVQVAGKLEILEQHCDDLGRRLEEIRVTHLGPALVHDDPATLRREVEARPGSGTPEQKATSANAGSVEDQIGRFRELADAGVSLAIVDLVNLQGPAEVEKFAPVVAAFS